MVSRCSGRGNALLILGLRLHVLNGVAGLHAYDDGLAGQGLHKEQVRVLPVRIQGVARGAPQSSNMLREKKYIYCERPLPLYGVKVSTMTSKGRS